MDDFEQPKSTQQPIVIKKGRGCIATLVGSALTIVVSAALGAALAILFMWYGPRNVGLTFPDSTGRLERLETAEQTAVLERTTFKSELQAMNDLDGTVENLRSTVTKLESAQNTREVDLDSLQKQIDANLDSLLVIQQRIDELESVPANASLANRLADAEVELAQINATLQRMSEVFTPFSVPQPTSLPEATPRP